MRNLFDKSDWQWLMVCGLVAVICFGENHIEKQMIKKRNQYLIENTIAVKDSTIARQNKSIDSINKWIDNNYPVQVTINPCH